MNQHQLIAVLASVAPDNADSIAAVIHDSLPLREELPGRRRTERKKVERFDDKGQRWVVYVEVGFYADGRPGEVFLKVSKDGTILRDLFDGLAVVLSVALQHGVPLSAYPLRGVGNETTGEGNALLEAIFTAMEELCAPHTSSNESPSSTPSTTPPSAPE